jgi:hypothetical protein
MRVNKTARSGNCSDIEEAKFIRLRKATVVLATTHYGPLLIPNLNLDTLDIFSRTGVSILSTVSR